MTDNPYFEDFDNENYESEGEDALLDEVICSDFGANSSSCQSQELSFMAPEDKSEQQPENKEEAPRENTFANHQAADYEMRRAGYYITQKIEAVQAQLDGKAPRPKIEGDQPPLKDQIRAANQELAKIHKKISPYMTLEEKDQVAKDLWKVYLDFTRMEHGLKPGTSEEKLWDCVRQDEAKKLGLPANSTFEQIYVEYDKRAFAEDCKFYGLDPQKATQKDLEAAQKRREFERDCEFYKLDPKKATVVDLEDAREQYRFEEDCKEYGLDPKKTTREECKKVREFHIDCHLFKVDPKDPEAAKKIHTARCKYWGLPPTASEKDIEQKVKESEAKRK